MKKNYLMLIGAIAVLGACTTPKTVYKNPRTGQVMACGGNVSSSLAGGAIGYHIQKSNDNKCRESLEDNGFVVVEDDREEELQDTPLRQNVSM